MPEFEIERVKSWDQLMKLDGNQFVFRGQGNACWPLKTTLERACERVSGNLISAVDLRRFIAREFRRRLHLYDTGTPQVDDAVEWFAIMQHHGAPTPLLDFTYSLSVATYFAVEEGLSDAAVWRIDASWCLREGVKSAGWRGRSAELAIEPITEENSVAVGKLLLGTNGRSFVYPVNPLRLNERLARQRGVFLWSGDVTRTMVANLSALRGSEEAENVLQIIIPQSISGEIIRRLYRLGVWRPTLFPGLDGFACGIRTSMLTAYAAGDWVVWSKEK